MKSISAWFDRHMKTRIALQLVLDSLNSGQRQKLMKDERVAALLERYGLG